MIARLHPTRDQRRGRPGPAPLALRAAVGLALLLAPRAGAVAQDDPPAAPPVRAADALVLAAREAQRSFELTRRSELETETYYPRGSCEEEIGRFCYWYVPPVGPPSPEPRTIRAARRDLLEHLTGAFAAAPQDGWVAGQLVRYLVEHGSAPEAVAVARRCAALDWWCAALQGYALHATRDDAAADSAFARALAAMPEEERCAWTDLTMILRNVAGYDRKNCADRMAWNERLWWLSKPLLARPGNDLRVNHYARMVHVRMLEVAANPQGMPFGADMAELEIRYGWATSWKVDMQPGRLSIIGHEPGPSYWFYPDGGDKDTDPTVAPRWNLDRPKARARYAPAYAASFGMLRHTQVARFRRRGGAVEIVAGFDVGADTGMTGKKARVTLAAARDDQTPVVSAATPEPQGRGVVTLRAPWNPALVDVSAQLGDSGRLIRARIVADSGPAPSGFGLSDLLLFRPDEELPDSLPAAAARAFPAPYFPRSREVGVYWELYESPDTLGATVEVQVVQLKLEGVPSLAGRNSCGYRGKTPVSLKFRDEPGSRPRQGRAVTLDLSRLTPGRYAVTLRVTAGSGAATCSAREIDLR